MVGKRALSVHAGGASAADPALVFGASAARWRAKRQERLTHTRYMLKPPTSLESLCHAGGGRHPRARRAPALLASWPPCSPPPPHPTRSQGARTLSSPPKTPSQGRASGTNHLAPRRGRPAVSAASTAAAPRRPPPVPPARPPYRAGRPRNVRGINPPTHTYIFTPQVPRLPGWPQAAYTAASAPCSLPAIHYYTIPRFPHD